MYGIIKINVNKCLKNDYSSIVDTGLLRSVKFI